MVSIAQQPLLACIDTGATFSLLAERVYEEIRDDLPALRPPQVYLTGAGGESLQVRGAVQADIQVGNVTYSQLLQVGRLEGLDLLLGMDWLTTYGVAIDCAAQTIRMGSDSIQFGRAMAVNSGDLVRMAKTVRVRPRGVQRVACRIEDPGRRGREVLVEGITIKLGDGLHVISSLEVVRDDGSLPLTIENQGTTYAEIEEGSIVAKITDLPEDDADRGGQSTAQSTDSTSDGGETPPVVKIWHIPAQVASINAVGTRHGKEWTSQPLIPAEGEDKSPGAQGDCKLYYAEKMAPAERLAEPIPREKPSRANARAVPDYLRCMFPTEGVLSADELRALEDLVMEYEDIFVEPDGSPGFTDLIAHKIDTGDAKPIKQNYYRRSMKERAYVDAELEKMLANGVIRPSKSPWGAPVVLVRKKTGELRFCIDFRRLNEVTKKDAYPLPRIDECLDALEGSTYFSTLDLASGYWQVAMDPQDAEKTAFVTHRGLYQWTVMPFGLCNAPATFCRLMEMVLADIVWSQCLVYLDDILAFGKDFKQASLNLRAVFERLRRANLKLKPKKCQLFATSVEYLGHEVDKDGIRPSRSKVQALHKWAVPKNLSEVRTYLGFTGYYRRFVPNYSDLAKPLTSLTKKGATFVWGHEQQSAFEKIKGYIEKVPLLYYPLPDTEFHLKVDASLFAIGGILEQEQHGRMVPLGFASKTLCKSRQAYCATKRELYAVVFFMRYFRDITRGTMVVIWTDHAALTWVQAYHQSDNMFIRWIVELSWYLPWKIHHVPGKLNEVADTLSRKREGHPEQQEAFSKRRPCRLGECPDCLFFDKKLNRCRDPDSDDSDDKLQLIDSSEKLLAVLSDEVKAQRGRKWRFAERDIDSDEDGEEPEFVDGIDFNVHLTRRLHEPGSKRSTRAFPECVSLCCSPDLPLTETQVTDTENQDTSMDRERLYVAQETQVLRRSRRLASKRERARPAPLPLVAGETDDDLDEEDNVVPIRAKREQTTAQAEAQCVRVLAGFSDRDWREVQNRDLALRRVAELKHSWGAEIDAEECKKESPEVRAYCRWWEYIYCDADTKVWMMDKIIQIKRRPTERLQVRLVPVAWRESIWRCVHVHSVNHLGYERVYELLRRRFHWPGMAEDVRMMCRACLTCQHAKLGVGGGPAPLKHDYVSFPTNALELTCKGHCPKHLQATSTSASYRTIFPNVWSFMPSGIRQRKQ